MIEFFVNWLLGMGLAEATAVFGARLLAIGLTLLLSLLAYAVARNYFLRFVAFSVARTDTKWDDIFERREVFDKLAMLAPAAVIYLMAPLALAGHDQWTSLVTNGVLVYVIIISLLTINAFLTAVVDIYRTFEWSREVPIRGFVQVAKIVVFIFGLLVVASIVFDTTLLYIFGSLGAATAVLMLIFQDSILSLVAGIQLTANEMVARGDYITMPKFEADGTVLDIALTTIKVQNGDLSITTIPTQALISEAFKNWRGREKAGVRRLMRAIGVDVMSIRPLTAQLRTKLQKYQRFQPLFAEDAPTYETNLAAFRAYALHYLTQHPRINKEMPLLVRLLDLTEKGIPIEVYAFCTDMGWANFEATQAEITEHLLMMMPVFGLRPFQSPTSQA